MQRGSMAVSKDTVRPAGALIGASGGLLWGHDSANGEKAHCAVGGRGGNAQVHNLRFRCNRRVLGFRRWIYLPELCLGFVPVAEDLVSTLASRESVVTVNHNLQLTFSLGSLKALSLDDYRVEHFHKGIIRVLKVT